MLQFKSILYMNINERKTYFRKIILSIQECHNLLANIRKLQSKRFNINNEVKQITFNSQLPIEAFNKQSFFEKQLKSDLFTKEHTNLMYRTKEIWGGMSHLNANFSALLCLEGYTCWDNCPLTIYKSDPQYRASCSAKMKLTHSLGTMCQC